MLRNFAAAVVAAVVLLSLPVAQAAPGTVTGSLRVDGNTWKLTAAESTEVEDLFDSAKRNALIVLSSEPLGELDLDDGAGQQIRSRSKQLALLRLRFDRAKLINAGVVASGFDGIVLLPGPWFTVSGSSDAGTISLANRSFDGHSFAAEVTYRAVHRAEKAKAPPIAASEAPPPPAPTSTPTLPPSSTSFLDSKTSAALLVAAIMEKDEAQAVKIVKTGIDPNARDQYGIPVLNWAVMTCMPKTVKALVDAKADLTYERAPGMTVLTEAGACPEAAKILREAGAR